jgi:hypothetical protein
MSHNHDPVICPNCGFHAAENYCARCGQETHLHKDTFRALLMHFIGHYFHYDSKFWKTMKALWFSPGKLTTAYWNKQRMRYLSPISLYIFISAVYFLTASLIPEAPPAKISSTRVEMDSVIQIHDTIVAPRSGRQILRNALSNTRHKIAKMDRESAPGTDAAHELEEKVIHALPKVFFFMIPLMAIVLRLLFFKRKDVHFVHHTVFSFHFHSLWFSLMTIANFTSNSSFGGYLSLLIALLTAVYFLIAARNVYKISWGKSVVYSAVTFFTYAIAFAIAFVLLLVNI